VLAGGAGARLGNAKPLTLLGGRPLISHTLAAALQSGCETLVIAKRHSPLPTLERCDVVYEPDVPQHPLCGIVTALRHAAGTPVVVVGCDMPFLAPALLAWLAETPAPGSVVAAFDGQAQPLLARYAPRDLPALEDALELCAPLRRAVDSLNPTPIAEEELCRFGEPTELCFNVNDPATLAQAEELLAERNSALALNSKPSETATSSAESESAPEKSVAKRP
jgi:molybdopterin-guanine dinucleotide biosynthesis protein A